MSVQEVLESFIIIKAILKSKNNLKIKEIINKFIII